MFDAFDRSRIGRARRLMKSEQLHKLKFSEAFRDQLAMTALLIDMPAPFTSGGGRNRRSVRSRRRLPVQYECEGRSGRLKGSIDQEMIEAVDIILPSDVDGAAQDSRPEQIDCSRRRQIVALLGE
jgi:hypothetical protein